MQGERAARKGRAILDHAERCWEVVTPCGAKDSSTAAPAWTWQEEYESKAQPSPMAC